MLQEFKDVWRLIMYASRRNTKGETQASATEKELAAILYATQQFMHFIWGRNDVTVVTDHHSLCWLHTLQEPRGKLARMILKLQEFTFTIKHKSGKSHDDADCLSRYPVDIPNAKDLEEFDDLPLLAIRDFNPALEQDKDLLILELKNALKDPSSATTKICRQSRSYILDKKYFVQEKLCKI